MRDSLNTEANLYDDFLNKMKKDRVTTFVPSLLCCWFPYVKKSVV